jgi:hypothetical protein
VDVLESALGTSRKLAALAQERGIDLTPYCMEACFLNRGRYIDFWYQKGEIRYSMQGPIQVLPREFRDSASSFSGMWCEAGSFHDINQALVFLKAWIVDLAEVDDLPVPERQRRRYGISGV